jgi:hypothetical protein
VIAAEPTWLADSEAAHDSSLTDTPSPVGSARVTEFPRNGPAVSNRVHHLPELAGEFDDFLLRLGDPPIGPASYAWVPQLL